MKVKFKVLELVESSKEGSELEIGGIYKGDLIESRIYYTDKAEVEWVFYPGDTCEILGETKSIKFEQLESAPKKKKSAKIFKLIFADKTEYAQAQNQLHLLQSYDNEYCEMHDIQQVIEISADEASIIMIKNNEYDEDKPDDMPQYFSLYDTVCGDDFAVVASTEWI